MTTLSLGSLDPDSTTDSSVSWRAFHAFATDLDRLVVDCVAPFFEREDLGLMRRFWERHYAGGANLRIRLGGDPAAVERAGGELVAAIERHFASNPSEPALDYSQERAAALLEREEVSVQGEDLTYRCDIVVERPYPIHEDRFVSTEARWLMEDFRHDLVPLVVAILRRPLARRELMLRFFFFQSLVVFEGDLAQGSVSWKSHWEGFSSTFSDPRVVDRIRTSYQENHELVLATLAEVRALFEEGTAAADPILSAWRKLLVAFSRRAEAVLSRGVHITGQPETVADAEILRHGLAPKLLRRSEFVEKLWSNSRFLAAIQFEPTFLVPRVLANLLYVLLAEVGLNPLDKHALCYFAHRAVEERLGLDLTRLMEDNVQRIAAKHADQLR